MLKKEIFSYGNFLEWKYLFLFTKNFTEENKFKVIR